MDPLRLNQAPVLQDWRRNVATTVVVLTLGTILVAGGADWSYRGLKNWAHSTVNTNITVPMTPWQLEVRMRWVKAVPLFSPPVTIHDVFEQHPMKARLYSVALLCSPRWALMWAWLFDSDPGLKLLHQHIAEHQASSMDYARRVIAALTPDLLPERLLDSLADNTPLMRLLQLIASLQSSTLFWLGWLLCPGLHTAYYTFFFAGRSPIKCFYTTFIGLARTAVEVSALLKCLQAVWRGNRASVVHSMICCYLLPLIMTLQSLGVLLLFCLALPNWITHILIVAFCLWGPPVMIALMTTAFQPDRQRHGLLADPPVIFNGVAAVGGGAFVAGGRGGAAGAAAAMVGAAGAGGAGGGMWQHDQFERGNRGCWGRRAESVFWPAPLTIPEHVEESGPAPHYFVCPITHCIMSEPAVAVTGATYERSAIVEWLKSQKRDPLTGRELWPEQISPNLALYRAIEQWLETCSDTQAAAAAAGQQLPLQGSALQGNASAKQQQKQKLQQDNDTGHQVPGNDAADAPARRQQQQQQQQPRGHAVEL